MTASIDDPLASGSGQFPLGAPAGAPPAEDTPSPVGLRPWGLRSLVDASHGPARAGRGDPTANTTSTVDGEDPPSSEDWKNDFHPDEPPES